MAQILLTLRNDDGTTSERTFDLGVALNHLDAIDDAVDRFKNEALPVIEQALLHQAQERIVAQEKKTVVEVER